MTVAQRPLSVEQADRSRRYLMAMLIRTACVLGAIVVPGWPRWVLISAAVALPYVAVVAANAAPKRDTPAAPAQIIPSAAPALTAASATADAPPAWDRPASAKEEYS